MPRPETRPGDGRHQHRQEVARQTRAGPVQRARKRRVILDLRAAGLTYEAVAAQATQILGKSVTEKSARTIIERALKTYAMEDQRDVERIRQMDLYRIDAALQVLWPKVKEGNLKAMREYRAFIDQRSRLLGTYAAQKHEVSGRVDHVLDAGDREEIRRLEEAFITSTATEIPDDEHVEDAQVVDEGELPSPRELGLGDAA